MLRMLGTLGHLGCLECCIIYVHNCQENPSKLKTTSLCISKQTEFDLFRICLPSYHALIMVHWLIVFEQNLDLIHCAPLWCHGSRDRLRSSKEKVENSQKRKSESFDEIKEMADVFF